MAVELKHQQPLAKTKTVSMMASLRSITHVFRLSHMTTPEKKVVLTRINLLWRVDPDDVQVAEVDTLLVHPVAAGARKRGVQFDWLLSSNINQLLAELQKNDLSETLALKHLC